MSKSTEPAGTSAGPASPVVRLARLEDHETLVDFNARLAVESEGRELDRERLRPGVLAILQDASKGQYHVVELAGRVVACLLITWEFSDWRNGMFWWIQSVYTEPEVRGSGMFGLLYDRVYQLARGDSSVCGLRLYVEHENGRARHTYEHRGMKQTGYLVYEDDFTGGELPASMRRG